MRLFFLIPILSIGLSSLVSGGIENTACGVVGTLGASEAQLHEKRRETYYRSLSREIAPDVFAKQVYGESGGEILAKLGSLGPAFKELAVDVGLMQYLDGFVEFARTEKGTDPWEMRRRFREKMGTTRIYRLMGSNEAKKDEMVKNGIHSPSNEKYDLETLKKYPFKELVWGHMASGMRSFLVSVTKHPEMWYQNTKFYINDYRRGMEDRKVYLFAINVNKCDVVGPREGVNWIYPEGTLMERPITITYEDGRKESVKGIGEKESFVLFGIHPHQIESVSEYEFKGTTD